MSTDKEIGERAVRMRAEARDVPMTQLPGYMEWSERKLKEGESEALIANLDARSMWLLPEEVQGIESNIYEELLQELKDELGE